MALLADRVKETSTSTGTGDFTLAGAVTGFQSFNTAFGLSLPFYYVIQNNTEWEVGVGHLSGTTTLVRDAVLQSTNSDALVSFSAGTSIVLCALPGQVATLTDIDNALNLSTLYSNLNTGGAL